MIDEALNQRTILKQRLKATVELSDEDHHIYFSSWSFATIHILLSIPGFNTKQALAKALRMPMGRVVEVLDFLVSKNLARQDRDKYSTGPMHIHLGKDSPMLLKHHVNWRIRALESLDSEHNEELHYSSVVSVSKDDVIRIKELLVHFLESSKKIINESKQEDVYSICLDFFKVLRS